MSDNAELIARLGAWRCIAELANAGWDLPAAATKALDKLCRDAAAALRAAQEREQRVREEMKEECAKACDARYMGDNSREDMEARRCAAAIRAIGARKEG
jgi:hypothetical protein